MMEWKISQTRSSGYREGIITRIGSVEQGYYKAYTGVIRKKLYEFVNFYSRTMLTKWNHDKLEVRVDNKSID